MKTFVLVHGAWMGARVWERVARALEANGSKAIVGGSPAPFAEALARL